MSEEIFGQIVIDNITFDVSYRYGGPKYKQSGFSKCLVINSGLSGTHNRIDCRDYFGDDKFEVEKADIYVDDIILHLTFPLAKKEDRYTFENMAKTKMIMMQRK